MAYRNSESNTVSAGVSAKPLDHGGVLAWCIMVNDAKEVFRILDAGKRQISYTTEGHT